MRPTGRVPGWRHAPGIWTTGSLGVAGQWLWVELEAVAGYRKLSACRRSPGGAADARSRGGCGAGRSGNRGGGSHGVKHWSLQLHAKAPSPTGEDEQCTSNCIRPAAGRASPYVQELHCHCLCDYRLARTVRIGASAQPDDKLCTIANHQPTITNHRPMQQC